MYHLIQKRLNTAFTLLLMMMPGAALHAAPIPVGSVSDQTFSHEDPTDNSIFVLPLFNFVPIQPPNSYSVAIVSGPAVVNVSIDGADNLVLDPVNGTEGTARVELQATDMGGSASIFFDVTVTNAPPSLNPIADPIVDEGNPVAFTATASDGDGAGDLHTYSLGGGAPAGASITAGGVFSWTPGEADGPGSYGVDIIVEDELAATDTQSITITVDEVNVPPVLAAIGDQSIDEGNNLSFTAGAADSDDPANTLTWSLDPGAPTGASINSGNGDFDWTPTEAQGPLAHSVTIRVSDGGLEDFETFNINVGEFNEAPVLSGIGDQSIDEGSTLNFTASSTDTDLPANTLTYTLDAGAPAGASITPTGDFSWTPGEADGPNTYSVTVRVSDGGLDDSETLDITVNEVNVPPVLGVIGAQSVDEGSTLNFTAGASDVDDPANTLTYSLGAGAPGTASIDPNTGDFTWTPTEADGPNTFNVTVLVNDGSVDDSETIVITVNEVEVDPVLDPVGDQNIGEESLLSFTATASDVDLPATGLNFSFGPGAPAGAAIDPSTGIFTWTPTEAQGPGSYPVTVQVTDGGGRIDDEAITITVDEVNVAPVLSAVGDQTVAEGALLSFTATATDADQPTANTLTYSLDSAPAGASIDPNSGLFNWTPAEGQGPGVYPVTVRVTDDGTPSLDDSETINITVSEINLNPVLSAIGDQSIDEGSPLTFTASATDADDPANNLTYSLDAGAPASASIDINSGAFTWTPTEGDGPATVSVTVRVTDDGAPALDAAETINITVNEVNEAPVLAPIGDQTINEEVLLTFSASATDVDVPANTLTYSLDAGAPAGASMTPAGAFTWTPAEADGPGTFTVTVRASDDGTPVLDTSETINITVVEINDPPALIPAGDVPDQAMNEDDSTLLVEVRNQFDDPDLGDTPPDTLSVVVLPGFDAGLVSVTPNGTGVDVVPVAHQYGTTTVTVGVEDAAGVQATDTFLLTVNSVNDPVQVATGIPDQGAAEDVGSISIGLAGAFSDDDLVNGGDTHTVTFTSSDTSLLQSTNSPIGDLSGTMNFSVTPDENGTATITVVAEDAAGSQTTITFDLTISEVTDPPFVDNPLPDMVFAEDPGSQTISLAGVFDDPDLDDGDVQVYTAVSDNGTLITSTGIGGSNLSLNFGAHENGSATVTVTVTDISGQTASDDFLVTVTAVNDDPTLDNPIANVNTMEDDPATYSFDLANVFSDVDVLTNGDVLSFSMSNSNPALFDVTTLGGSVVSLHLAPDQNGSATITVQATDSFGATATDSFDFNVGGVNDFPIPADDFVGPLSEDPGLIVIPVLDNDYLAEQPTSIASAGMSGFSEGTPTIVLDAFDDPISAPNGTVVVNGTNIEYQPKDDFFGTDFFFYTIVDADGDVSPPAMVQIQVVAVNDPPVGVQQRTFTIFENQTLTVDPDDGVFTGNYDVDGALLDGGGVPVGSALAAVLTVPPPMGGLSFDGSTGGFQFTPPINFSGEISFFYRLFDGIDVNSGAEYEVRVVVNPTPPAPLPPAPGTVAINYNISDVPLEQTNNVAPNVLVVMDDSGSMDWNMVIAGSDENGGFSLSNDSVASSRRRTRGYVYLWDLPTNAYSPTSTYGRVLPTEEALNADSDMTGNQYGVWRARNYKFNSVYYNPSLMYQPWVGQDINNVDFANANPAAIRLEPRDSSNTFDILSSHSYTADEVPEWNSGGGTNNVGVNGARSLYIPRYYTTTANSPVAWNAPHALVEITPGNAPWVAANGREDCATDGDPTTCSYTEEIQNFANWFQYYRSREYVTKSSVGRVISEIQDIRIGYETISDTDFEEVRLMNDLYTEGNKKLLLDQIYEVDSNGGTPLRQALARAGDIFACQAGSYCPSLPAPDGMCQQNFALLFSDGYWNGGSGVSGNRDDDGSGAFDGGRYSDSVGSTLADVAMHYYETDLHAGLDNEVPLSRADVDGAPSGTFDATNNTMHQHMKTYTIAFGVTGTHDPATIPFNPATAYSWSDPFDGPREKIDDMLHAAVNGRGRFMNARNAVDLQASFEQAFLEFTQASSSTSAAAFNSTSLRDGTLLYRGFFDLRDNTGELTATVVNNDGTLAAAPTWRASDQLEPGVITPGNRTLVTSHSLTGDGMPFRHTSLTPDQQLMMSLNEVNYIRGERNEETGNGGILRDRPANNGLLGDIVNSSPVFVGNPRAINRDQAPYSTTDLYSDFAATNFSRRPVVYVGANDGILHGFDAQTGLEVFGYLPSKNMDTSEIYHNNLEDVTSPFYQHKYYVDLTPSLNDVYMRPSRLVGGKEWITLMLGGLGAGGKGLFALNVTDPDGRFTSEGNAASTVLWEFTDEDDTYPINCPGQAESACAGALLGGGGLLDSAGRPVKDLGITTSQPTLTMSNVNDGGSPAEHEWVAVLGNGLNSTAGVAKLFVIFVNSGVDGWGPGDVVKIDTGVGVPVVPLPRAGYPNGLGTPTAVDVDLNGTVDWVYAGDRLGNLYRFDLSNSNPDNWTSTRLFTASYTDGGGTTTLQPILSKPVVSKHPTEDGFLVTFGTGSHIAREDANSRDIQSIYTIWDRGEVNPATALPSTKSLRLVEQVMTNVVDDSLSPPQTRRILTSNPVPYVSEGGTPGVYGWYIDLDLPRATNTMSGAPNPDVSGLSPPDPQFPGEKAIRRMLYRDGTMIAATVLPSIGATSCFGSRPGSILLFDVLSGGNPIRALVDFNNDGYVNDDDLIDVAGESYSAGILFDQDALDGSLVDPSILGGEGDTDFLFISGGNETTSFRILDVNDNRTGRLSWQELD